MTTLPELPNAEDRKALKMLLEGRSMNEEGYCCMPVLWRDESRPKLNYLGALEQWNYTKRGLVKNEEAYSAAPGIPKRRWIWLGWPD